MRCAVAHLVVAFAFAFSATVACGESGVSPRGVSPGDAGSARTALDASVENDRADGSVDLDVSDAMPDAAADATSPLVVARPYAVKQPSKYDPSVPTPLVVLLHGYAVTATWEDDYLGMSTLAETRTLLLALPEGTKDKNGLQFWNASDACCDYDHSGVDDVAYLKAVIADAKARFNVDAKRVYLVGHSNGGFMAHRLACEASGEIAGIASLAGAADVDATTCAPSSPVAVLQVHGDADTTIYYLGNSLAVGVPHYPSAPQTVAMWAAKNGCAGELVATGETHDLDSILLGKETTVARHACTVGAADLWTIHGGGHVPSLVSTWAEQIYGFLDAHPKP